jgi:hypothetical protein
MKRRKQVGDEKRYRNSILALNAIPYDAKLPADNDDFSPIMD